MDPELALIQSNICAVRPQSLVLDPFCGTGGVLIPAAEFGGTVVGTEINYQVFHCFHKYLWSFFFSEFLLGEFDKKNLVDC